MILGDVCTRNRAYCAVAHGRPPTYDTAEPARVASAVAEMGLRHAVITLGGPRRSPRFRHRYSLRPFGRSTRGFPTARSRSWCRIFKDPKPPLSPCSMLPLRSTITTRRRYLVSTSAPDPAGGPRVLEIFRLAKRVAPEIPTKTGMIMGMGETMEEVITVMQDLRGVDVDILTLGQYLRPSTDHMPVDRYYTPDEFRELARVGKTEMGFRHVESGPLVRSSYHAWEQVQSAAAKRQP